MVQYKWNWIICI